MASRIPLQQLAYSFGVGGVAKNDRMEMTGPAEWLAFMSIESATLLTFPGVSDVKMQVQLFAENDAQGSLILTIKPGDVLRVPHTKAVIINPNPNVVAATFARGVGEFFHPAGYVRQDKADQLLTTERPLAEGDKYTLFQDLVGAGATQIVAAGANVNGIIVASGSAWAKGTGAAVGQAALWATDNGAHALEMLGAYCGPAATDRGADSLKHEWLIPAGLVLECVTTLGSILSCSFKVL